MACDLRAHFLQLHTSFALWFRLKGLASQTHHRTSEGTQRVAIAIGKCSFTILTDVLSTLDRHVTSLYALTRTATSNAAPFRQVIVPNAPKTAALTDTLPDEVTQRVIMALQDVLSRSLSISFRVILIPSALDRQLSPLYASSYLGSARSSTFG